MKYDKKIDEIIIQILNDKKIIEKYSPYYLKTKHEKEGEQLNFNGISRALRKLYRHITNRILSLHLKNLEDQTIIKRGEFKPGLGRFCWLSKNTKLALELELPVKVKSERAESYLSPEVYSEKNKKVYLLIMSLVTIGIEKLDPVTDNFVKDDLKPSKAIYIEGQDQTYITSKLPGVSPSDLFHPFRDFANGWRFRYLQFKDHSEVDWYFRKLMEFEPPIIMPINDIEWIKREQLQKGLPWPPIEEDKETRYGVANKRLHEFLTYCIVLLGDTEMLMEYIWKYKRKPSRAEKEWYSSIYGKAYVNSFFTKINDKRSRLEKRIGKTKEQIEEVKASADATYQSCVEIDDFKSPKYKSACEIQDFIGGIRTIDRIKSSPYYWYQKLSGNEYSDIHSTNYNIIAKALLGISYPEFMKDIIRSVITTTSYTF